MNYSSLEASLVSLQKQCTFIRKQLKKSKEQLMNTIEKEFFEAEKIIKTSKFELKEAKRLLSLYRDNDQCLSRLAKRLNLFKLPDIIIEYPEKFLEIKNFLPQNQKILSFASFLTIKNEEYSITKYFPLKNNVSVFPIDKSFILLSNTSSLYENFEYNYYVIHSGIVDNSSYLFFLSKENLFFCKECDFPLIESVCIVFLNKNLYIIEKNCENNWTKYYLYDEIENKAKEQDKSLEIAKVCSVVTDGTHFIIATMKDIHFYNPKTEEMIKIYNFEAEIFRIFFHFQKLHIITSNNNLSDTLYPDVLVISSQDIELPDTFSYFSIVDEYVIWKSENTIYTLNLENEEFKKLKF